MVNETGFVAIWYRCLLVLFTAAALNGQIALKERVLVVYNANAPDSLAVARHYMAQRQIPDSNRCRIAVSSPEYLKQEEYEARVKAPLRKCIEALGKQKILYIVFSYLTPYDLIIGQRTFALDSYVADLWDDYAMSRPGNEVGAHPYFGEAQSQGNVYGPFVSLAAYRELPKSANLYAVWRLDAATPDLAKGLVDKAVYAEAHGLSGKGCFDLQYGSIDSVGDQGSSAGDWDIHQSAELARLAGFEVVEDGTGAEFGTAPAPLRCDGAALYAGWYSLGLYNDAFTWTPGAIGFHLDSASATNTRGGPSWVVNAVSKGITITSGAVEEPYLEGLAHPDQVFRYIFQGANAGDALLRSTRWLKWMIVNIGDPLYQPFPKGAPRSPSASAMESLLALLPQTLVGGDAASGVVAMNSPAREGGVVVSLSSSRPDIVSVPKSITIPAQANTARFPIITHPVNEDGVGVQISMKLGEIRRRNTMVLYPCMQPLTLSVPKVVGGSAVVGTVVLSRAATGEGVALKISSAKPLLASAPPEVKVPAGSTRAAFQISTSATSVNASTEITVSLGGCTRTAVLTVTP